VARSKLPKWAIKQAGGINKKAWRLARRGQRKRSKTPSRKRATRNPRKYNMNKKGLPHPSITGLASLALLGGWINSKSGWVHTQPSKDSVTGWLMKGDLEKAASRLSENLKATVTSDSGRKAVVGSIAIAAGGAILRKHIPRVKLGTQKTYLTI